MSKRILFLATDPAEREGIRTDLAAESGWETFVAGSFEEAVTSILAQPVDAIVAHHQAEDLTAAEVLNWAAEHFPRAAKLLIAEAAEREDLLRIVLAPHHFLPKPVSPGVLRGTIESALLLDGAMPSEVLLTLASRIKVFPPLPSLYFRVLNELKSPDFSAETVGEIVAKDLAMTTRLLQVINSGFYSLPRRITDLTEAVNLLGQESVKSLIIGIHLFLQHEHIKPLYFSINQLWRHSTAVGQAARLITQMETGDPVRADEAYTAGLLHDIGKLVLANNFEVQYNKVQKAARETRRPLWEVETEEFGVSHGELGAFILGRWGMPVALLEATALHHQPSRLGSREFSVLTAVHIANAFEHEQRGAQEGDIAPALDLSYLDSLHVTGLIDGWRECVRDGKAASNHQASRAAAERRMSAESSTQSQSRTGSSKPADKPWLPVVATVAATVALVAACGWYLGQHWPGQDPMPAHAKTRLGADGLIENSSGDTNSVAPLDPTAETNAAPANGGEPTKPKE